MTFTPRDYQLAGVDSIWKYYQEGGRGNIILAYPPGTGKSVVIALFVKQLLQQYPYQKALVLTHVKELIVQNYMKLTQLVWPGAPAGIYSAGLKRKELNHSVTFGGIASIRSKANEVGAVNVVLIDECHLVSENASSMYRTFIDELRKINPSLIVIGLTATTYRTTDGSLLNKDGLFNNICFDLTTTHGFNWFIDNGYLSTLIPKRTNEQLNVQGVHIRGGEFAATQLQAAVDLPDITEPIVDEIIEFSTNRNSWLVFTTGISHSEHVTQVLRERGVNARAVHAGNKEYPMSAKERDKCIADFKANKITALVNTGVLTTGFDHPDVDLIAMLRPTMSPGLWVQILGRGIRPVYADGFDLTTTEGRLDAIRYSTKQNCLVLDFAGNAPRLGPINNVVKPIKDASRGGGGNPRDMPNGPLMKPCPNCTIYMPTVDRRCEFCQYVIPFTDLSKAAGTMELIQNVTAPIVESFRVSQIFYSRHRKTDRPDSLKVVYVCGLASFKEFICLEHGGGAKRKAYEWWLKRIHSINPTTTIDELMNLNITVTEALTLVEHLPQPTHIDVWTNTKHPELRGYSFDGDDSNTPEVFNENQPANGGQFFADDIPF